MSEELKSQKHPIAIAWEKWLASTQGQNAREVATLPRNSNYLENRLWSAFMAGAEAGLTPTPNSSVTHRAAGNLAFLLSVIRSGETLAPEEEASVRGIIRELSNSEVTPADTEQLVRLREALRAIEQMADKTLIADHLSLDPATAYQHGANAAFQQVAGIASAALETENAI